MADETNRLRKKLQNILMMEDYRDGRLKRIEEMKVFLQEQTDTPLEYDEQFVRRLVEKVTVYEIRLWWNPNRDWKRMWNCRMRNK